MTCNAHEIADKIVAAMKSHGVVIDDVSKSTNRFQQKSAYLVVPAVGQIRISDHSANLDFRPGLRGDYSAWSAEDITADLLARIGEWKATEPRRAQEKSARAEAAANEAMRIQAIRNQDNANRQQKIDFFARRPDLSSATETVRRKAWEAHKKSLRNTGA